MQRSLILILSIGLALTFGGCRKTDAPFEALTTRILEQLSPENQAVLDKRVTLSKPLLRLAGWIVKAADEKETHELLTQLQRLDVAVYHPHRGRFDTIAADVNLDWLQTLGYEPSAKISQKDERILIFFRTKEEHENEMLTLVFTPDEWIILRFRGEIDRLLALTVFQDAKQIRHISRKHS
ncbi:DUF4252 domain-containing protein [candidate division KSB1 bacterium]|nr:DUF4252 domain-containing protein [candidate division KSB1 bacterium]